MVPWYVAAHSEAPSSLWPASFRATSGGQWAIERLTPAGRPAEQRRPVPNTQPSPLLTKPHGLFSSARLGPLSSSWLRHHRSLSRDTHPPASPSQVVLGLWLFLECSVTSERRSLGPGRENLRWRIPTRWTRVSLQGLKQARDCRFSWTALCCAQLTGRRNPSSEGITLLHSKPILELTKTYRPPWI